MRNRKRKGEELIEHLLDAQKETTIQTKRVADAQEEANSQSKRIADALEQILELKRSKYPY